MSNPARDLFTIFEFWFGDSTGGAASVVSARGWEAEPDPTPEYLQAMECLIAIDRVLRQLAQEGKQVSSFRSYFGRWVQILVMYPKNWAQNNEDLYQPAVMSQLESLAAYFDVATPGISDGGKATLRGLIVNARALIAEDDSLPQHLKDYIRMLINQIEEALDTSGRDGSFDYATTVHALWVALGAAAGLSTEKASFWRDMMEKIVPSVAGGVLTNFGIETINAMLRSIGH